MVNSNSTRVLLFGDSITLGAVEISGTQIVKAVDRTYVEDLRAAFPSCDFRCDAKLNRMTTHAVDELPASLDEHRPEVLVLMLGGNDGDMNWKRFFITKGKVARSNVQPPEYGRNLRTLAQIALRRQIQVVLTDIPDFDIDARAAYIGGLVGMDMAPLLIEHEIHRRSKEGLHAFWEHAAVVSQELQVPLIPYGRALAELPRNQVVGPDGVHPSETAHRVIGRELTAGLREVFASLQRSKGDAGQGEESLSALRA